MKTNYTNHRTIEGREIILKIAGYATRNMMRSSNKSKHYARIVDECKKNIGADGV